MSKRLDFTGQKFGYLTVVEIDPTVKNGRTNWKCLCKCGNYTTVVAYQLRSGKTISCGCRRYETKNQTHGMKHTRLYETWCGMKKRCYNHNEPCYFRYGGKGITVCDEWKYDFMSFYNWSMENGYSDELTIDRIDNSKGYAPDNCRWITHAEQQRNKTNNVFIEHNGETKTLAEWCRIMGEPYPKIHGRIKSALYHYGKFDFDDLFFPKKKKPIYTEKFYNRKHYSKRIAQYSKDGVFIRFWNSTVEAGNSGFNKTAITNCLKGRVKTSGGYIWRYAGE